MMKYHIKTISGEVKLPDEYKKSILKPIELKICIVVLMRTTSVGDWWKVCNDTIISFW